ncbi:MAG: hypothetical protein AAGG01_08740 [Planctomycetota bacterium]
MMLRRPPTQTTLALGTIQAARYAAAAVIGLFCIAVTRASAQDFWIPSSANLYAAGLTSPLTLPSGGGTVPVELDLALTGPQVRFGDVRGTLSCCLAEDPTGPDGLTSCCETDLDSLGGISGLKMLSGAHFLAGVFLTDAPPTSTPPPILDQTLSKNALVVSPLLQQTFFIGDGRANGLQQTFVAPPGATRLFLGIMDGLFTTGPPGYYADNRGGYQVSLGSPPATQLCECDSVLQSCYQFTGTAGCNNQTGLGAQLFLTGSASVASDTFTLDVRGTNPSSFVILFLGSPGLQSPLGNGQICIVPGQTGIARFPVNQSNVAGDCTYGPGLAAYNQTNHRPSAKITAGQSLAFQAWYRDFGAGCGGSSNFSSSVLITFEP